MSQTICILILIVIILVLACWIIQRNNKNKVSQQISQNPIIEKFNSVEKSNNSTSEIISEPIVYYFASPSCPFCIKFDPVWNSISKKMCSSNHSCNIHFKRIDVTKPENYNIEFYYNITQYPTVIFVQPNKSVEYSGPMEEQSIIDFIKRNI